jgi:ABC-type polysaccharide/polyol phosphate transport system ATPase subunit
MTIIQVDHISKRFELQPDRPRSFQDLVLNGFRHRRRAPKEEFWALRDVSFTVKPGENLGIIGANGSGKSTCLKLLTRIIEPTSGTIQVHGRVAALLELGAGFHPELTGRENIFLNGSVLGLSRREMARRFDEIVAFAELERFVDIPVKFYSSGMYVRLAFATAINVSADVLLVDEVLAVGDQRFQDKCLGRIHELRAGGTTIVFVSHSLDAVRSLCDRVIWLDEGRLVADGLAEPTIRRYLQHVHNRSEREGLARMQARRQASAAGLDPSAARFSDDGHDGSGLQPLHNGRRWGSFDAEVVDVAILDADGRERYILAPGEPMRIVIGYRAHRRIEHPMFGLAIHRDDGLHISGPNNVFSGYDIPYIDGAGCVTYYVDTLPLLEGTYHVTAAIHDTKGEHTYDYHKLNWTFRVQRGDVQERYGIVYMPSRWEHVPGTTLERQEAQP